MSTKSTLRHGESFHLYSEAFDKEAVYLEVRKAEFTATHDSVTVRIPLEIWEYVRQATRAEFDLAKLSDAKLRELVRVRLKHHLKLAAMGGIFARFGARVWGEGSDHQKLKRGFTWFKKARAKQRELLDRIASFAAAERKLGASSRSARRASRKSSRSSPTEQPRKKGTSK
ncbi:hypothetical protein [Nibricoccus sp. IMCC34717]|uniref:hypothetical protein n=1 Tax=Nibricoccus sp. IMCC34717 TaxID=3034021 RepID=UPI003850CDCC